MNVAEMEMNKAKNLIVHEKEIYSRPARVWFQSKTDAKRKGANGKRCNDQCN